MIKAILLRFGIGRIPKSVKLALQPEGIDFLEEGIWDRLARFDLRPPNLL